MAEQHVLITGASSGLGRALSLAAARRASRVGLIARRHELLADLAGQLTAQGAKAAFAAADVTDFASLSAAVHTLEAELGPVTTLVASAGVYRQTDGAHFDPQRAALVFQANVIGVSNALGAVLPGMVARRSGIVCAVASLGALLALPKAGAYCASKAAVGLLMNSVRLDVAPHGVQVTTVYPGFIDTPMITDHERTTARWLLTADQAAQRIFRAIDRKRREAYFPFGMWLEMWLARHLPWPLYRWVMARVPPMEET